MYDVQFTLYKLLHELLKLTFSL